MLGGAFAPPFGAGIFKRVDPPIYFFLVVRLLVLPVTPGRAQAGRWLRQGPPPA